MTTMHPRGWSGAVVWSCRRAMHELGLLIVASHFLVCFCCVSLLEAAVSLTCGPWSYRETMQTPIKICRNFSCSPCDERARARHQFTTYVAVRTVHEQINVVVCLPVFVTLEWQSRLSSSRPELIRAPKSTNNLLLVPYISSGTPDESDRSKHRGSTKEKAHL